MRHDPQQINVQFQHLPTEVQDYVSSAKYTNAIQEIGNKHGLHIDQTGIVGDEILAVILGLDNATVFAKNIQSQARLDANTAGAIAREAEQQIFAAMRASFNQAQSRQEEEDRQAKQQVDQRPATLESATLGAMETPLPDTVLSNKAAPQAPVVEAGDDSTEDPAAIARARLEETSLPSEERTLEEKPLHERVKLPERAQKNLYKGIDPYHEPLQ